MVAMKNRIMLTADLHLTDKVEDAYRWEVFPWFKKMIKRHRVDDLFILGDITDRKDKHSGCLVNQIIKELRGLGIPVTILKGNHDFDADPDSPFFGFLDETTIRFVSKPELLMYYDTPIFLSPYMKGVGDQLHSVLEDCDLVFAHQTFMGAVGSNDHRLRGGLHNDYFGDKPVFSGDVHVPQTVGNITYVGAPYPIHFGDEYEPRVLILQGVDVWKDLGVPSIRKRTIDIRGLNWDLSEHELAADDQVKIRVHLHSRDFHEWPNYRLRIQRELSENDVRAKSIQLHRIGPKTRLSIEERPQKASGRPEEVLHQFCSEKRLGDWWESVGQSLFKGEY